MKINSPAANTSKASIPKRFKEKNRIKPPHIKLVCKGL
jgi:hypothetical protein